MLLYTVKQSPSGSWLVQRQGMALFSDLKLLEAVRLARTVARDENTRSGRQVRVELHDNGGVLMVGNFDQAKEQSTAA